MDFKEVCCNIRSCLNSSKSQLSLTQLLRDYHEVLGEHIPYRTLGFNSAESLIRAVPNLRISTIRGELFIDVKPDEKTAHIASLVREQKCAKKKKKKPASRYFNGRYAPPPRRPAPMPPPRRSAPPARSTEYYPSRRRDSPPRQQSYQNQRRPSPPRRPIRDNYYAKKRDSPPPAPSYQPYRNSAPIEISSDEDDRRGQNIDEVCRKYRSHPSQFDFSDPNEEFNDEDASDLEDCDEINMKMEELKVTLGNDRQVSINKPKLRSYSSNTSNEDDIGYSSMNEINAITTEILSGDVSKGKGDMACKSKMNIARTPAALLAAGRAMQEPDLKPNKVPLVRLQQPKSSVQTTHSYLKKCLSQNSITHGDIIRPSAPTPIQSREPFRTMNKPSVISNKRPSPAQSPVQPVKPNVLPVTSKMSDSNMFKPGPHVQPDLKNQKYCAKLHEFAIQHALQIPQYKTFVKFSSKTKAASYMCKVKIGSSLSFASCPYESNLISDVQEYTAKIALEYLQKRYANSDSNSLTVTTDGNTIIKRIAEIVNPHSNGLKSDTIESKYENLHKEILPLDWLNIVKNRSLLSVEELMGGIIAVYPIEGGMSAVSDVSKLPPLILPENEVWNVYVTCCMSTSCVFFRIIHDDYNGLYAIMDEKMFDVYDSKRNNDELRHVDVVKEGSFYAAFLDGNWFRVKALSTIIDDVVRVCLIDHGDIDEVPKEELFPLDERFTTYPAQKVSCSLTGLEEYSKELYVSRIVYDSMYGRPFVAKVDTRNPTLQLTFLDTSTDVDINVNEKIVEKIKTELQPPKIPSLNNVTDAYLISVKEDGLAYVQIYSESFKLLKSFLDEASEELAANYDKYCVKSTTNLLGSKIFLSRYTVDGLWYRVVIDRVVSDDHIEVLFIDYGSLEIVTLKDIADVDHFTEALSIMPNQAVQVRLVKPNEELFTDNVLQFLMDLSLVKESAEQVRFLLKTVKEGAIPDVQLFYRMPENNQLVNVNELIAGYFPEFRGPNYAGIQLSNVDNLSGMISIEQNVLSKRSKKVDLKSKPKETLEKIYPIPTYDIPVNEQINVLVTMVSSPFNFIIQPQDDAAELIRLNNAMTEFYNNEESVVDVSTIKEKEIYAVRNANTMKWYRGVVVMLTNSNENIPIKLVDYGTMMNVSQSHIAHLLPSFRTLPRQAIRAELAGITPLHSDWSVEDSLRFQSLVSEMSLISIAVEVFEDGKVSIILFDASTNPPTDLGAVLVQEGRAKDITDH